MTHNARTTTPRAAMIVVEDDVVLGSLMAQHLSGQGFAVQTASSAAELRGLISRSEPEIVLLDVRLPDGDGLSLLPELTELTDVIVLTAFGSVQNAVDAVKAGATEYLLKPVNLSDLNLVVSRVLERRRLRQDVQFLRHQVRGQESKLTIGTAPALVRVQQLIHAVAPTDVTVLIMGDSGVGKELIARDIHEQSTRRAGNFVVIDCCTLQDKLFESELFGHERGAFTGADRQKTGLIEMAAGGTLFLDEIGEIEPTIQAKLLRVLETGKFRRLGGNKELSANVRVVTATNRDLERLSQSGGAFREDLYYRLSGFTIRMPPLRDRREDIPALVEHFICHHDFSRRISKSVRPAAMRALVAYDWPGNIRELKNTIERAIILSGDERHIGTEHLLFGRRTAETSGLVLNFDHDPSLETIEREYLTYLLKKHSGQRAVVAQALGVSERNVYRLLQKHGVANL